jgi:hypothetical protein
MLPAKPPTRKGSGYEWGNVVELAAAACEGVVRESIVGSRYTQTISSMMVVSPSRTLFYTNHRLQEGLR